MRKTWLVGWDAEEEDVEASRGVQGWKSIAPASTEPGKTSGRCTPKNPSFGDFGISSMASLADDISRRSNIKSVNSR